MRDELATTSTPNPQPPCRLVLGELLRRGVLTEVYRAHDGVLDRPVAVKVFHPAAYRRFDTEAYALARLGHPGLVSVFDVGSLDDRPYLVLQLIDGPSLADRLRTGSLPMSTVVRMGAVLADGLAHAHERGVVHRDVNPGNILLDRYDAPHLTDFDVALLTDRDRPSQDLADGTSAYAAPEQSDGAHIGPAVDVYAMGLVLLDCLTGTTEYSAAGTRKTDAAGPRRTPRIPAGLTGELADLLTMMTAHDPGRRPSAAQCADTLRALRTAESHQARERSDLVAIAPGPTGIVPGFPDVDRPAAGTCSTIRRHHVPAPASRVHQRLATVAAAAAIITATALVLANLTHSTDPRPTGPVAFSPQSTHDTTSTHATAPAATGVQFVHVAIPRGTPRPTPIAGNQSVADIQHIPESEPSGSLQAPPTTPSDAAAPTTTNTVPTSELGAMPTPTPPTTPTPPAPSSNGSPGTGSP